MSRFVECLRTLGPVGLADVEAILDQLKQHLQAERAFIELKFPYFVTKKAPVSGMEAPMDIDCVYKRRRAKEAALAHYSCCAGADAVPLLQGNQRIRCA